MAGVLSPPLRAPAAPPAILPLQAADAPRLRLPSRASAEAARLALSRRPGRSVWVPETLEYALIGCWRNRPEISSVDELVAVRNFAPLLRSAQERCFAQGDELMLAVELETTSGASRFERAGMEMLEEVITYEIDVARVPRMPRKHMRLVRIVPGDSAMIDRVTRLDQSAFPWLWRNSRREFDVYLETPGVQVSFVEFEGTPVAYVGTTLFPGWGHLDRIAVSPALQGRGFGRAALILAIDSLRQGGARRIGLSTQQTNERSRKLYDRFGFRRTPELDYRLYGAWRQTNWMSGDRS